MIWTDKHQWQGYRITLYIIMHAVRWLNKNNVVNDVYFWDLVFALE